MLLVWTCDTLTRSLLKIIFRLLLVWSPQEAKVWNTIARTVHRAFVVDFHFWGCWIAHSLESRARLSENNDVDTKQLGHQGYVLIIGHLVFLKSSPGVLESAQHGLVFQNCMRLLSSLQHVVNELAHGIILDAQGVISATSSQQLEPHEINNDPTSYRNQWSCMIEIWFLAPVPSQTFMQHKPNVKPWALLFFQTCWGDRKAVIPRSIGPILLHRRSGRP